MSIFHQHIYSTLKYCSNVIYQSGHELGSLRWETGALPIRYRTDKSLKTLLKFGKLTLQKFIGKS